MNLHGRYTRADVYGLFGIDYDTRRTRHLNVGFSPRMSDEGYQIFVTLNKETLEPDYDYEDILFQDQLIWVTRRGAAQDDPDYVALRDPATRVSVFVRRENKEPFAYLGEVHAGSPEQLSGAGRVQQRYSLILHNTVPDPLFAELTTGSAESRGFRPEFRARACGPRWRWRKTGQAEQSPASDVGRVSASVSICPRHR